MGKVLPNLGGPGSLDFEVAESYFTLPDNNELDVILTISTEDQTSAGVAVYTSSMASPNRFIYKYVIAIVYESPLDAYSLPCRKT